MADLDARKIRKVARLLGMKPKELLDELEKENTTLQEIVDAEKAINESEDEADLDARKIKKVARLLSIKPKELLEELEGNPKLQRMVEAQKVPNFFEKAGKLTAQITQKEKGSIEKLVANMGHRQEDSKEFKELVELFLQDAPHTRQKITLAIFIEIIGLIIAVLLFGNILADLEEPFSTIIRFISAVSLLVFILILGWKLCNTVFDLIKAKKSPKRYAIEEIVKLIKHIDDEFPD